MGSTESAATGPQQTSTFILVPEQANSTVPAPGAFIRLGNYSHVEETAPPDTLYPRQHVAEGGDFSSAPGPSTFGIALACSGRLLVHALEKSYIYSAAAMHIDTADTFTLNSDMVMTVTSGQSISITSGNAQSITISADGGLGDVALIAMQNTKTINGDDYEWITKDTYKYFECDTYTYRVGEQYYIAQTNTYTILMGVDYKIIMGATFSLMLSFAFELTLSAEVKINIAISLKAGIISIGFGVWDWKLVLFSGGIKDGEFNLGTWAFKQKAVQTEVGAITTEQLAYALQDLAVAMDMKGLTTQTGILKNNIYQLMNAV